MLLDGVNKQSFISDRIPLPVDVVADTSYVNSITGETVQLYYFSNALLTCAAAGETTASTWAALAATSTFEIDINSQTYIINPDFTGDASMANVAASIQTALRTKVASVTCAYSTDHFVITTAKDESGDNAANNISVLRNPTSNTGTNIAGASWMNGLYGAGIVTQATPTTDAGEAAGTVVIAKLAYSGILDTLGVGIGNKDATSLAWTTGTVLPAKYMKDCPKYPIEDVTNKELVDIAYDIVKNYSTNGEWCLDHRLGVIFGKKASTGTSDTAAYKVATQTTGGGTSISESINVAKYGNVAAVKDDAAYAPATHYPVPVAGVADEASTDSVDEGDLGYLRMTLDRKQINASEHIDDAALAGGKYTTVMGARADEDATDSVDEGDAGYLRMTLDRLLLSSNSAQTANGLTPLTDADADNTAQTIKGSAGNLYNLIAYNPNTTIAYVQIFNHASPTVGTTAAVYILPIPPNGIAGIEPSVPITFSTAITYAATTTATGSGDPTTGLVLSAAYK